MAERKGSCAVYTRKSSEEGLDHEFNSLQAQREACEAFIDSQRHEGWVCLPVVMTTAGSLAPRWIGRRSKRYAITVDERGVEAARPDQQLDQPRIGFGRGKRVGPVDPHLDLAPGACSRSGMDRIWVSS